MQTLATEINAIKGLLCTLRFNPATCFIRAVHLWGQRDRAGWTKENFPINARLKRRASRRHYVISGGRAGSAVVSIPRGGRLALACLHSHQQITKPHFMKGSNIFPAKTLCGPSASASQHRTLLYPVGRLTIDGLVPRQGDRIS